MNIQIKYFATILAFSVYSFNNTIEQTPPKVNLKEEKYCSYSYLRNFLYNKENNLYEIKEINVNKSLYITILAKHIQHLRKKDFKRKVYSYLTSGIGITCSAFVLAFVNYFPGSDDFKYKSFFSTCYATIGVMNLIIGMVDRTYVSKYTQIKTERDQRIINKLNQL